MDSTLEKRNANLNEIIGNFAKMLSRIIGEHISVRTELDPASQPVLVDPGQIEEVLLNLAVNARDAMPHGGELSIRTRRHLGREEVRSKGNPSPEENWVMLSVTDTGCGIPKDVIPRIFDLRAHRPRVKLAFMTGHIEESRLLQNPSGDGVGDFEIEIRLGGEGCVPAIGRPQKGLVRTAR